MQPQTDSLRITRLVFIAVYVVYVLLFYLTMATGVYEDPMVISYFWLIGDVIAVAMIIIGTVHQHPLNIRAWVMFMLAVITYFIADTLFSMGVSQVVYTSAYTLSALMLVAAGVLCINVMNVTIQEIAPNAVNAMLPFSLLLGNYLFTTVANDNLTPVPALLMFIICLCDFMLFTGHVVMFTSHRARRMLTPRVALINASFVCFVIADVLSVSIYAQAGDTNMLYYANNHPFWSMPLMLLATASTFTEAMPSTLDPTPVRFVTVLRGVVPYALVLIAVLLLYSHSCRCPEMTAVMVAACMIIVRLMFITLHNHPDLKRADPRDVFSDIREDR